MTSERSMKFSDLYPEYTEVDSPDEPGVVYYQVKMVVGGRDEDGEFLTVLDGPAQGERAYID